MADAQPLEQQADAAPESAPRGTAENRQQAARRRFCGVCLDALGAAFVLGAAGTVAYVGVEFVKPPARPRRGGLQPLEIKGRWTPLSEVLVNSAVITSYDDQPALVIRDKRGVLCAFVAVCTHLSCNVSYDPETERIVCPCHRGIFDLEGRVVSGPPPKPLRRLYVVEKEGQAFLSDEPT